MADTATFSGAMKTRFIGPIRDNLHNGKVLLFGSESDSGAADGNPEDFKGIKASAENIDFVGNEFRIPWKRKRNQAVGFRSENETLPAPGASTYTYLTEPLRYAYGLFNITGQLLKASETNEGAFKAAFKQEMEDTVLSLKLDFNRAAYNDGSGKFTGVRVAAVLGATTIDVDSTINFRGGEVIDFVTAAGVVISPAHEVTGVNRTLRQITVSPGTAAALTTAHFPVRASTDSTIAVPNNSQNKEIQGLTSIVSDTGTLHGINPTTDPLWKSYKKTAAGALDAAGTLIRDAIDAVGFESGLDLEGSNEIDFAMVTTRGVRSRYAALLVSLKQFVNAESQTLRGGFKALDFDGYKIFTDDQCPLGRLYGLSLKDFFWAQMSDWDWMDEDGNVLKHVARKDRYEAVLYKYCQLGTTRRNGHFVLEGVTDDVK